MVLSHPTSEMPPRYRVVTGPRQPGLVQTVKFARRPFDFLQKYQERYGDVFRMRLVTGRRYVIFNHPRAVQEIFQADPELLQGGQAYRPLTAVLERESLIHSDGESHRSWKPTVGRLLSGQASARAATAARLAHATVERWPTGKPIVLDPLLDDLVLNIAVETLLGKREEARLAEVRDAFRASIRQFTAASFTWFLFSRMAHLWKRATWLNLPVHRLTSLLTEEIHRSRRGADVAPSNPGIVAELVSARQSEDKRTDRCLFNDLLTILIGIYFGLGGSLQRTLAFIARSPEVQRRLTGELTSRGAGLDMQRLAKLPYLDAVCRESLRLCPATPFVLRTAVQPMAIHGYQVEPGEVVGASMALTHRRADIFENPDSFCPERFLERTYTAYEYYPFGGGQKRCVGARLATLQLKAVLAALFGSRRIQSLDHRPLEFKLRGLFMVPARKLTVQLHALGETPARRGTGSVLKMRWKRSELLRHGACQLSRGPHTVGPSRKWDRHQGSE